ncbi:hypothetical protein DPMN_181197 [Dreissena polymorpha]|uniref:Uncharacterized protein n=2 Tax=Dreissena polymorpha TaxID=45954 RepID=A0A9D4DDD0_DREPO|nr:hypothetical protein DPMN_181197 [Dreissena polymorpha]
MNQKQRRKLESASSRTAFKAIAKTNTIGVQYLNKAKVNSSYVIYRTFSLSDKVNEWTIPAKALSPSLENVLTLHFDRLEPGPVNIDYLKLAFNPRKWGTQSVTMPLDSTRNLRALKYRENASKKNKDVEIPKGMNLYVDGKRIDGEMEKVVLMHKPNLQVFAISENGKINVNHVTTSGRRQNRRTIGEDVEDQLKGASGFLIGNPDNNIEAVAFNTKNNDIKITYANSTFVTFTLQYSVLETRLVVTDTNIADGSVTFFSTHISDGLAGANDVIVDGGVARKHVMDPSVGNLRGTRFKFVKTNPDQTFDVSAETEIVFPVLLSG